MWLVAAAYFPCTLVAWVRSNSAVVVECDAGETQCSAGVELLVWDHFQLHGIGYGQGIFHVETQAAEK
jgi:hypothetical protein